MAQKSIASEIIVPTLYPMKYAQGFVVLRLFGLLVNLCDCLTHVLQSCFTVTGTMMRLLRYQQSNSRRYGETT